MINSTLFKKSLKSNFKIIFIFIGILFFYSIIIISMFDPNDMSAITDIAEFEFSPELLKAFGFDLSVTALTGFLASFLYGMIMLAFPMIAYIILGNRLIASMVDKGSMSCLLSTPISRKKVALTQAIFLVTSITFIIMIITTFMLIFCQIMHPGHLDIGYFIKLNFGLLLLHLALSSICFCSSCIFNESSKSLLFGAGIPILFFIIQMLANSGEKVANLKYITLFTLFNPNNIINGESVWLNFTTLFIIGVLLYSIGIIRFNKKDLPI